ncbi:hypothetical protein MA16_Dca025975 [Dendrobium catenatum]|uniref:Uncharacterized protein n=1 Tax=Dendrobium catenatum TaxID=906689 RepID=A0A2I0W254_9ASPA|nr:hypothetical protein MA16_Dca025975 [Dendrobium catenatum]
MLQLYAYFGFLTLASLDWKACWTTPPNNLRFLASLDGHFWQPATGVLKDDDDGNPILPLDGLGSGPFWQPGDQFILLDDFG